MTLAQRHRLVDAAFLGDLGNNVSSLDDEVADNRLCASADVRRPYSALRHLLGTRHPIILHPDCGRVVITIIIRGTGTVVTTQDGMLETLVAVANKQGGDFAVGVTLTVHGAIIGGLLVPATRWMKDYEDRLAADLPPAEPDGIAGHGLAAIFIATREHLTEAIAEDQAMQDALDALEAEGRLAARYAHIVNEEQSPTYIHLRHAKYWHPAASQGMPGNDGMLWRGRLSQVDGWSMGNYEHIPAGS